MTTEHCGAGRRVEARCNRCNQVVTFVATGFDYGPLFLSEEHFFMDEKQKLKKCGEPPFLIKHELVEVKPMETPTTAIFALDYLYRKINDGK